MKQKLIDGFLREIESSLNDQVIPNELNSIILNYYCIRTLICYLTVDYKKPLHIADVSGEQPICWKSTVLKDKPSGLLPGHTKPCIGYNISSFLSCNASKCNTAIFQCGGYSGEMLPECSALMFDTTSFQSSLSEGIKF